MSSGMVVRSCKEDPKRAPIEIWRVLDGLEKKSIPKTHFAKRLGIRVEQLVGKGTFPPEKVDACWHLLENWESLKDS